MAEGIARMAAANGLSDQGRSAPSVSIKEPSRRSGIDWERTNDCGTGTCPPTLCLRPHTTKPLTQLVGGFRVHAGPRNSYGLPMLDSLRAACPCMHCARPRSYPRLLQGPGSFASGRGMALGSCQSVARLTLMASQSVIGVLTLGALSTGECDADCPRSDFDHRRRWRDPLLPDRSICSRAALGLPAQNLGWARLSSGDPPVSPSSLGVRWNSLATRFGTRAVRPATTRDG
jgi:hypothetical protein